MINNSFTELNGSLNSVDDWSIYNANGTYVCRKNGIIIVTYIDRKVSNVVNNWLKIDTLRDVDRPIKEFISTAMAFNAGTGKELSMLKVDTNANIHLVH